MATLLETFRVLSSFAPERGRLKNVPWEAFADWALMNGLAPLAAYNLEYRLAGADAPEEVRDRLLSIYQGSINDNVMKLVNFKRSVDELEGRKLVVLSGGSLAEAVYPHIAFRPVIDIDLLIRGADIAGFSGFMKQSHFQPEPEAQVSGRAVQVLSDTRTEILLHASIFGGAQTTEIDEELMSRALPMRVYGPSIFRPSHEDAILTVALSHAQAGYQVPMLSFVDLRELLLGAPSLGGPYSQAPDFAAVKARAKQWRIERALYASVTICERLFPETAEAAAKAKPELKPSSRALIDRLVVNPVSQLSTRTLRGAERIRRWLTGREK